LKRQIAIIDPAVKTAETDCFNHLVQLSPLPLTYHLPKLAGVASLTHLKGELAGIILLGSGSSVNDGELWQKQLNEWLKPKLDQGIPALGLCFGHQLLAHLYGGKVGFLFPDQHKLLGFREVSLKSNPLWGAKPLKGPLVVSHKEAVLDCPATFEIVGSSPEVPVDAIAHRQLPLWGFQSHPESTPSFVVSQGIQAPEDWKILGFGYQLVEGFFKYVSRRN
jgi:GMP synthase-like glutamine amidotransferase